MYSVFNTHTNEHCQSLSTDMIIFPEASTCVSTIFFSNIRMHSKNKMENHVRIGWMKRRRCFDWGCNQWTVINYCWTIPMFTGEQKIIKKYSQTAHSRKHAHFVLLLIYYFVIVQLSVCPYNGCIISIWNNGIFRYMRGRPKSQECAGKK